jgi:hypothetical protein
MVAVGFQAGRLLRRRLEWVCSTTSSTTTDRALSELDGADRRRGASSAIMAHMSEGTIRPRSASRRVVTVGVLIGLLATVVGVIGPLSPSADAAPVCTKTFTGDDDDRYINPLNWDPLGVPGINDYACSDFDMYFETNNFDDVRNVRGINFDGILEIYYGELRIGSSSTVNDDSFVNELYVYDGRRGGRSTLTVNDSLDVYDGRLGSPNGAVAARGGRTVVGPAGSLFIDGGLPLDGQHTLRNEGEALWFFGDVSLCDGSTIENAGTFELPTDGDSIVNCVPGAPGKFVNEATGTVTKLFSGSSDTIATSFTNDGTLVLESDTLSITGDLTNLTSGVLTGGSYELRGTLKIGELGTGGLTTNAATVVLDETGAGIVNASDASAFATLTTNAAAGTLDVRSGNEVNVASPFANAGKLLLAPGGVLRAPGANSAINLNGGRLEGVGSVQATTVRNNGGVVAPGTSPGVLTVNGNFQQGASGTLEMEIDGTTSGTTYDQLVVTGSATVNGTLDLTTGFNPADSDVFTLITAASRTGGFSIVNGQPGPGRAYQVLYPDDGVAVTPSPPPPGVLFTPLDPVRILDSRPSSQEGPYSTPWVTQLDRPVKVAGVGDVPADAEAVVLNVTATGTTASSHLRIYPTGEQLPTVSNLNWQPGWTIPNAVTVKVGTDGNISVYNNNGSADVIIDVVGYYKPNTGAGFTSLDPVRVIDSRPSSQVGPFNSPWLTQMTRDVNVTGYAGAPTGVPSDADAVVLNVTVTGTTASSNLRLWPTGVATPLVSNLNWRAGWTIPNAVTVKVGAGNQISVYNNNGSANVIIDVVGYFDTGSGSEFHPLTPSRIQDSRPASQKGLYNTPWGGGITRPVTVTATGGVPLEASAVLMNTTVTGTTASSNLRVWPIGPTPTVSSLNWQPAWTIANAVTAKVGPGTINVYNNNGNADVIADVAGWYG